MIVMMLIPPALGIDLGTTNSTAAIIYDDKVTLVTDEQGEAVHASALAFGPNNEVIVGNRAHEGNRENLVLFSLKRLIGIRFDKNLEQQVGGHYPYTVVAGPRKEPFIKVGNERFAVPELCGMILKYLKDMAENTMQLNLDRAVITVPAHFTDTQRQMTRLAAELAGLKTLRIINEPTAAALGYGFGRGEQQRLAIYDLGGGTFDMTILDLDGNIIEVLATGGDGFLGGDDFDRALLGLIYERLNLTVSPAEITRAHLLLARKAKHQLTSDPHALIPRLTFDGVDDHLRIMRSDTLSIWLPLVERTFKVCKQALKDAGIKQGQIDHVILVGGTTRIPVVQTEVARFFGKPPISNVDPDTVVAIGAATQAYALLAAGISEPEALPLLIDVLPQTLGIASVGGTMERVIERNSVVPVNVRRTFSTTAHNQTCVRIQIFQGESAITANNTQLGEVLLEGIPPAPQGEIHIDVVFEIDVNGCLLVQATDHLSGSKNEVKLYISAGYDDETLNEMRSRAGLLKLTPSGR
jgi:molecular chaperone DnaK